MGYGNQKIRLTCFLSASAFAFAALWISGCGPEKPLPYPNWVQVTAAEPGSLTKLGEHAAVSGHAYVGHLRLSPADLDRLEASCATDLAGLPAAVDIPMAYRFRHPFMPDQARTGWQLLGTVLDHKLQKQLWAHDDLGAADTFLLGLRFGVSIAGGDASDVAVGFPMVDTLRATLVDHLIDLSPAALIKLSQGVEKVLRTFPTGQQNAENERLMMLSEIQDVQDAYRDSQLESLELTFQPVGHDLLHALETLRERDDNRRVDFFNHLKVDADAEADWIVGASRLPANKRLGEPIFKPSSRKPWQALAHYLFAAGSPMLRQRDLTLARTRLLYLKLLALASVKTTGSPPDKLPTHEPSLVQDPYCGEPLHYVVRGKDIVLYSVGVDGLDNGGETDTAHLQPDLLLESSEH